MSLTETRETLGKVSMSGVSTQDGKCPFAGFIPHVCVSALEGEVHMYTSKVMKDLEL